METNRSRNSGTYDNSRMYGDSRMHGNSTMYGDSEMHNNSVMHGNSQMRGNSRMYGNSEMCGNGIASHPSHIVSADMVGDDCSCLTVHPDTEIGIRVNRGCFTGSVTEFLNAVAEKPEDNPWRELYPQILYGLVCTVAKMLELYPIGEVPMDRVEDAVHAAKEARDEQE